MLQGRLHSGVLGMALSYTRGMRVRRARIVQGNMYATEFENRVLAAISTVV